MKRVINVVFVLKQSTNVLKKPSLVTLPVILLLIIIPFFYCFWLTSYNKFLQCGVHLVHFTHCFHSFISNLISCHSSFFSYFFLFSLLSSLPVKSSDVNVLFIFIISLNPFAPSSPILFPGSHSFILFSF